MKQYVRKQQIDFLHHFLLGNTINTITYNQKRVEIMFFKRKKEKIQEEEILETMLNDLLEIAKTLCYYKNLPAFDECIKATRIFESKLELLHIRKEKRMSLLSILLSDEKLNEYETFLTSWLKEYETIAQDYQTNIDKLNLVLTTFSTKITSLALSDNVRKEIQEDIAKTQEILQKNRSQSENYGCTEVRNALQKVLEVSRQKTERLEISLNQ